MAPKILVTGRDKPDKKEEVSGDELTSVMTALEPDQLISAKEKHHFPRRQLTQREALVFWALRVYLIFMLGVVIFQIWTSTSSR